MAQMQNNMSFTSMGFKGGQTVNGFPIEGQGQPIQTVGGIFSTAAGNDTFDAVFGLVVSADTSAPNTFLIGAVGAVVRGIVLYDPSIAMNEPFKNNYYLKGTPMTVANGGSFRYQSWTKTATNQSAALIAIDPVVGALVVFQKATGIVEFVPSSTVFSTGLATTWAGLIVDGRQAYVSDVDTYGGAVIKF
jgi:hypothetical protein